MFIDLWWYASEFIIIRNDKRSNPEKIYNQSGNAWKDRSNNIGLYYCCTSQCLTYFVGKKKISVKGRFGLMTQSPYTTVKNI